MTVKRIGRREFIIYSAGLGVLVLVGKYAGPVFAFTGSENLNTEEGVSQPGSVVDGSTKFAMVIDVGACIGCRRCQWACKKENNIPDTISPPWIEVFELGDEVDMTGRPSAEELKEGATTSYTESPRAGKWYLPVQCYHCDNPPCVKVCPTGATYKDKDGIVSMNYDRCIGCRFCVVACPYSARRFNWWKGEVPAEDVNPLVPLRPVGVVEKCTFCVHRVRQGKLTRCVEVCPVQARHFGNLNDPESEVAKILKSNKAFRLLEEVNTEPRIWYITRGKKWTEESVEPKNG